MAINYHKPFKNYCNDLAKRQPSPGGGSALAAAVCIGASLIEKSLQYSQKPGEKKLYVSIRKIQRIRNKILPLIDLDGKVFTQLLLASGNARKDALRRSEKIMIEVGTASVFLLALAKVVEFDVKKCIISDFMIGKEYLRVALMGVVVNLEANALIFHKKSRYIAIFKTKLTQCQKS